VIEGSSVGRVMTLVVEAIRPVKVSFQYCHTRARAFRSLDELDLRTIAVDWVSLKTT
jgi:hypothetical protein